MLSPFELLRFHDETRLIYLLTFLGEIELWEPDRLGVERLRPVGKGRHLSCALFSSRMVNSLLCLVLLLAPLFFVSSFDRFFNTERKGNRFEKVGGLRCTSFLIDENSGDWRFKLWDVGGRHLWNVLRCVLEYYKRVTRKSSDRGSYRSNLLVLPNICVSIRELSYDHVSWKFWM